MGKSVGGWLPFEIAACSTEIPMTHLFPVISETYGFSLKRGQGCLLLTWTELGSSALPSKDQLPQVVFFPHMKHSKTVFLTHFGTF